ncbi:MAG: tetratricopeptide repeat protein [Candidatus Bipolaricaulaceae bacterium]
MVELGASQAGGTDPALQAKVEAAYADGVREYQRALAIAPSPALLVKLGHLHLAVGDIDRARRAFVEAFTKWPGTPSAYAGLGDTLFAFGDYRGAIENYRNALWWQANGPRDAMLDVTGVRLSLAESFVKLHLPGAAINAYQAVLDHCPEAVEALAGLPRIYIDQQRWVEALAVLDRWRRVAPDDPLLVLEIRRLASGNPDMDLPDWADALVGTSLTSP